ncbi:MAG: endonuclease/exonuclease/phosphatase family protein [Cellulosilyticaceae bacterium]
MTALKITTFNIRYDCGHDGKNNFEYRKQHILGKIQDESPDLIGFQEVLPHVLDWLKENLIDYTVVGCGRGTDYQDEANVIAFKKESFELFGLDTFWLSPTPKQPGSRFEKQSGCPRICTVALLKHHELAVPIRFYNTHLDHESSEARVLGMTSILERMAQDREAFKTPMILTGDLNAEPGTPEIDGQMPTPFSFRPFSPVGADDRAG